MTQSLEKKVALIVGAGDFLGSAIGRRFAQEGYHVVGTRRRGDLATFVDPVIASGGQASGIYSDARDEEQVISLFDEIETTVGPVDVVVFNVGGNVKFSLLETTVRVYSKVWQMCALAGFLVGREAARRMVPLQRLSLIHI